MSWEVLTMRSVTSFFNPALARSDLRRHNCIRDIQLFTECLYFAQI